MISLCFAFLLYAPGVSAMRLVLPKVDIKKPIIKKPEIKCFTVLSLKQICFAYGIQKYGKSFIQKFEEYANNKKIKVTIDIKEDANRYYYQPLCFEIDQMLNRPYPAQLFHAPAAQPLNKLVEVVEEMHQKKRFELLAIINERYYAKLKWPAITLLAGAGYCNTVKILLDAGADINDRDLLLRTPLICAAKTGKADVVQLLIERNADLDCIDACKYAAAKHAAEHKHESILDLIHAKKKEKKKKQITKNIQG